MPRRFRNILLGLAVFLFLGAGIYLTTLGNGFVWDKNTLTFVKTGGIFLSFDPWGATVYLDGKLYPGSTSFLSRGLLIQNLPPKSYSVRLEKDGYYSWGKILTVAPGEVASAHDVRLWPKLPKSTMVSKDIKDFWITRAGILYQNATGTFAFDQHPVRGTAVFFSSPQSDWVVTRDHSSLFLTDLSNPGTTTNLTSLVASLLGRLNPKTASDILAVYANPANRSRLLIKTETGLFSLDPNRVELAELLAFPEHSLFAVSDRSAHVFEKNGDLLSYYFPFGTSASTTIILTFPTSSIRTMSVSPDASFIVFETEGGAYLYSQSEQQFFGHLDAHAVMRIFSPEGRRLFSFLPGGRLTITYLKEYEYDGLFAKGAQETGLFSYPVTSSTRMAWTSYENALLVMNSDSVIGTETDLRPPVNTVVLIKELKKAVWRDSLFLLKENGELWEVEY